MMHATINVLLPGEIARQKHLLRRLQSNALSGQGITVTFPDGSEYDLVVTAVRE